MSSSFLLYEQGVPLLISIAIPVKIAKDETIVAYTGGGGGFGAAVDRPPADVARDVREGYVSAQRAHDVYHVALGPDLAVLGPETAKLRQI